MKLIQAYWFTKSKQRNVMMLGWEDVMASKKGKRFFFSIQEWSFFSGNYRHDGPSVYCEASTSIGIYRLAHKRCHNVQG